MHKTVLAEHAQQVEAVMAQLTERLGDGCLTFERAGEDHFGDYVLITAGGGGDCSRLVLFFFHWDKNGTPLNLQLELLFRVRSQFLKLDPTSCMDNGTVAHELLQPNRSIYISG